MHFKASILPDLFFISRPVLWIPVWCFSLFGFSRGSFTQGTISLSWVTPVHRQLYVFAWILCFSCSVGVVYILNQIADREVDARNSGFPLLARNAISLKTAIVSAVLLSLITLVLPIAFDHPQIAVLSLISIIVGTLYSFKPFFFSGRPVLDFLSNAFGYGLIAFAAGWLQSGGRFTSEFLLSALPYFLLMCSGSINSTIPDVCGDAAMGKKTTAVAFGVKRAHILSSIFLGAALFTGLQRHDMTAIICAVLPAPFFILYFIKPSPKMVELTYKSGAVACMVCAMCVSIIFCVSTVVFLALTWIYFYWRFGVKYPSLVPIESEKCRKPE